jgi:hypothetical protein
MTKAAQIIQLFRLGKSTREIAVEVYSLGENAPKRLIEAKMAYVRVVARQRLDGCGESDADIRWRTSAHGRPIYNAKHRISSARHRAMLRRRER